MAVKDKSEVTGRFNWRVPSVVPSFVSGEDAERIYEQVKEFGDVWYDKELETMSGSNFPIAARIDSMLRPLGIRVANLADLSRPEIMEMIRGQYYSDTPSLVLRTLEDSYERNNSIIKELIPHIENKQGRLKLPVLISGLDVIAHDNEYGWNVVPRDDFNVVYNDKLDAKYNGSRFSNVDELGLPVFDKEGNRTWYARDGLSRLYLGINLYLYSDNGNLAVSSENGRVALVSGEAAPNFLSKNTAEIEAEYKRQESELFTPEQIIQAAHELDLNLLRESKLEDILLKKLR